MRTDPRPIPRFNTALVSNVMMERKCDFRHVAGVLGVSEASVKRWLKRGDLPIVRPLLVLAWWLEVHVEPLIGLPVPDSAIGATGKDRWGHGNKPDPRFDGKLVDAILLVRGETAKDTAKAIGVTPASMCRWRKYGDMPNVSSLVGLAWWLETDIGRLTPGKVDRTKMLTADTDACTVTRGGDA